MSSTTVPRPWLGGSGRGVLVDMALASVAFLGSVVVVSHGGVDALSGGAEIDAALPDSRNLDLIGVVLAAGSTTPLVAWRSSPLAVLVITAVAGVLLAGSGYPIDLMLGPATALYLLAASRTRHDPWTWRTTAIVATLLVACFGVTAARGPFPAIGLFHTPAAWAVAWFAGERTRLRREQLADLEERARRAERESEHERRLAGAEERTRIARDLHDSAAHAITVIAVRAGAARLRHRQDPDRSLLALEAIEEVARQTVEEIDQLVRTLREDDSTSSVEAPPRLTSLETLAAHYRAAGLELEVQMSGTPRPLGAAADQAAYRILQEALTNAARHGAGRARVELAFDAAALELTITNPVLADASPRPGGGHGLVGMHERATLLGGHLHAARVDGAFHVRAHIPYGRHRP